MSSPKRNTRSDNTHVEATAATTANATAIGPSRDQPVSLSDPFSQICARATSEIRADTSIQLSTAIISALTPMPISTSRNPSTPPRHASRYMANAVSSAPTSAAAGSARAFAATAVLPARIRATAPTLAPAVMPRMSGLASGLRSTDWVNAPARPSANPTRIAVSARGRRTSRTMTRCGRVPPPVRTSSTCPIGMAKSPREMSRQVSAASTINVATTASTIAGRRTRDTGPIRTAGRAWTSSVVIAWGVVIA